MAQKMFKHHLKACVSLLAVTAPLCTGALAFAAETPAANQLDEIIVTAQKRAEDITKVPTSISVLSGDALGAGGIKDFDDLTRAVPGISFAAGGAGNGVGEGNTLLEFRGVSSAGAEATVGLYLDEMSITNSNRYVGAIQPVPLDIARVEVLRGPQGTLYGASSEGGTIRYLHNKPDLNKVEGYVAADLSDTLHGGVNYQASGVVNAPIVEGQLALRLGALYGGDSGWIDNYNLNGQLADKGVNSQLTKALRADALYKPSTDFSIEAQVNYQRVDSKDAPSFYLSSDSSGAPPYQITGGLFKETKLVHDSTHDTVLSANIDIEKDLGFAELTSITSYFWRAMEMVTDSTYYNNTVLSEYYFPSLPGGGSSQAVALTAVPQNYPIEFQNYSQEVRLASPSNPESPIKWVGGAYVSRQMTSYLNDDIDKNLPAVFQQAYGYPISTINESLGVPASAGSNYWTDVWTEMTYTYTYQYAGFGQIDYNLTSRLHFSAGLRYQFSRQFYNAQSLNFFSIGIPEHYSSVNDYFSADPKFSLTYDIDDSSTAYTTAAKGYRIGGPTGPLPTGEGNVCQVDYNNLGLGQPPSSFNQDSLWSYEAGVKSTMADRTLSVDAAGYYIDWRNIQQQITMPTCGFGYTSNVGNAESYGGELELRYAPPSIAGLKLGVSAAVTKTDLTAVFQPFAQVGQSILYVPAWTADVMADYSFDIVGDLTAFVHADYDFIGHSHGAFQTDLANYEDLAYGVVNANLGVDDGSWRVSLYAKNLLNDHTIIQRPTVNSVVEGYTVRPLTFGLSVRRDF